MVKRKINIKTRGEKRMRITTLYKLEDDLKERRLMKDDILRDIISAAEIETTDEYQFFKVQFKIIPIVKEVDYL
jgi:hypothetical protein